MAQFWIDFADDTVGELPNGWTNQWSDEATLEVLEDATLQGGKFFRIEDNNTNRHFVSYDAAGEVSDVEIYTIVRADSRNQGFHLARLRGSGTEGSETAYTAALSSSDPNATIFWYEDGDAGLIEGTDFSWEGGTFYEVRFRATGNELKVRIWEKGSSEPTDWLVETTDERLTNGKVGVGPFNNNPQPLDYEVVGIGTNGDPAPKEQLTSEVPQGTVTINDEEITVDESSAVVPFSYNESDVTGYEYRIDGGDPVDIGTPNPLEANPTNLNAETQYTIEVRAYNSNGSGAWSSPSSFTTTAAGETVSIETDIDTGNIDASSVSIIDASSTEPTIEVNTRSAAGDWRHFLFRVDNTENKRPTFRVDESNISGPNMSSSWQPVWTTDFVTWNQFPSFERDGDFLEFQDVDSFTDSTVYIASHPVFRQQDAESYASELLSNPNISPSTVADGSGVILVTPSETDENDRSIGEQNIYGLTIDWGGSTNDGGRKRIAVLQCGIHSGEVVDGYGFMGFLDWVLNNSSQEAQDFRSNFILHCYFNLTPNGRFGGHTRTNFRSDKDPNRDFDDDTLAEIVAVKDAIIADVNPSEEPWDVFLGFHGWRIDREFLYFYHPDMEPDMEPAFRSAFTSFEDTSDNTQFNEGGTAGTDTTWAAEQGAKLSLDPEFNLRGPTDADRYKEIGSYFARSVQILDADSMFVSTVTRTGTVTRDGNAVAGADVIFITRATLLANANTETTTNASGEYSAEIPTGEEMVGIALEGADGDSTPFTEGA